MAGDSAFNKVIKALMADIDVDDAQGVLEELGLPIAYSDEAVATINSAADVLAADAADLKRTEAPRSERLKVRQQIDRYVNARALLYRLRPAQAGDVTVAVGSNGEEG